MTVWISQYIFVIALPPFRSTFSISYTKVGG